MLEKRKYVRANSKINLLFLYGDDNTKLYGIKSKNISVGGLYLIYDKEIPQGTILRIEMDIQDSMVPPENIKSKVQRCKEVRDKIYGIGIEFVDISDEMREAISRYVEEHIHDEPLSDEEQYLINNYIYDIKMKPR
jgi:hypothetical protein